MGRREQVKDASTPAHRPKKMLCRPTKTSSIQSSIEALAGEWGDDIGLTIHIKDHEAYFSDGTGPWTFEVVDGAIVLRGARLIGRVNAPVWRFPTGVERHWARPQVHGSGCTDWAEMFFKYKETRLQLRRQMQIAFATQDFEAVITLKSQWEKSCTSA